MIKSPFGYEASISNLTFQKLGELALRWSHIDHIIGNCLKTMLRLTDQEAIHIVFPLSQHERLQRISKLAALTALNEDAKFALSELKAVMAALQFVRNTAIHAIIGDKPDVLHLRSKQRDISIEDILSSEELTNYAAHAAISLRYALGVKGVDPDERHPLPSRPLTPEWLVPSIQWPNRP